MLGLVWDLVAPSEYTGHFDASHRSNQQLGGNSEHVFWIVDEVHALSFQR
jgi:hypothetical protein